MGENPPRTQPTPYRSLYFQNPIPPSLPHPASTVGPNPTREWIFHGYRHGYCTRVSCSSWLLDATHVGERGATCSLACTHCDFPLPHCCYAMAVSCLCFCSREEEGRRKLRGVCAMDQMTYPKMFRPKLSPILFQPKYPMTITVRIRLNLISILSFTARHLAMFTEFWGFREPREWCSACYSQARSCSQLRNIGFTEGDEEENPRHGVSSTATVASKQNHLYPHHRQSHPPATTMLTSAHWWWPVEWNKWGPVGFDHGNWKSQNCSNPLSLRTQPNPTWQLCEPVWTLPRLTHS